MGSGSNIGGAFELSASAASHFPAVESDCSTAKNAQTFEYCLFEPFVTPKGLT